MLECIRWGDQIMAIHVTLSDRTKNNSRAVGNLI